MARRLDTGFFPGKSCLMGCCSNSAYFHHIQGAKIPDYSQTIAYDDYSVSLPYSEPPSQATASAKLDPCSAEIAKSRRRPLTCRPSSTLRRWISPRLPLPHTSSHESPLPDNDRVQRRHFKREVLVRLIGCTLVANSNLVLSGITQVLDESLRSYIDRFFTPTTQVDGIHLAFLYAFHRGLKKDSGFVKAFQLNKSCYFL
ncbi:hypothetical protein AXF42_Ash003737 [Apostasia shenzhenica]|uniref:Uncharacterized protein n=1 Tax=Apostasia shenzhenica TaxID=1088818 RepID=A0A2I0AHT3_9ASPA|nr:hypothetical protein AXF42_Ash003737 [Apostasia shenzhenica]